MRKPSTKIFLPALLLTAGLALHGAPARADYAVDGYLSNDRNSNCMILKEHDGGTRLVAGAIGGLQPGDHVRLYVHSVNGGVCNVRGNAYEVSEVLTLWGDERHRTTFYDHLTDGSFSDFSYRNSYGRSYESGRSYDNGPREGELISLRGWLSDDQGSCPVLRTRDGQVWSLEGNLSQFRDHARARVTGWTDYDSRCGGQTLRVRQITGD